MDRRVQEIAARWPKDPRFNVPIIPLDHFFTREAAVCRHHALFVSFLLNKLIQDEILPPGKAYHHRDQLGSVGAHTWVMYKPDSSSHYFLIDSLWKHTYELPKDEEAMRTYYGPEAVEECRARYSPTPRLSPPLVALHAAAPAVASPPVAAPLAHIALIKNNLGKPDPLPSDRFVKLIESVQKMIDAIDFLKNFSEMSKIDKKPDYKVTSETVKEKIDTILTVHDIYNKYKEYSNELFVDPLKEEPGIRDYLRHKHNLIMDLVPPDHARGLTLIQIYTLVKNISKLAEEFQSKLRSVMADSPSPQARAAAAAAPPLPPHIDLHLHKLLKNPRTSIVSPDAAVANVKQYRRPPRG